MNFWYMYWHPHTPNVSKVYSMNKYVDSYIILKQRAVRTKRDRVNTADHHSRLFPKKTNAVLFMGLLTYDGAHMK